MKTIDDVRIGRKLAFAFLLLIVGSFIVSGVTLAQLHFVQTSSRVQEHAYAVLGRLQQTVAAIVDQESGVRAFLLMGEDGYLAPYRSGRAAFEQALEEARTMIAGDPDQQARLLDLARLAGRWRSDHAAEAIELGRNSATIDMGRQLESGGAGKELMDALRAKADELVSAHLLRMADRRRDLEDAFTGGYTVILAGGAAMLIVAIGLAMVVGRTLSRPLHRMTEVMLARAAGDRDIAVPDRTRRDELGAMARAIEIFKVNAEETERLVAGRAASEARRIERAREMETLAASFDRQVREALERFKTSFACLREACEGMADAATRTRLRAASVADAIHGTQNNTQTIAASTEELVESIGEIGRTLQKSADHAGLAVENSNRAGEVVGGLTRAVDRIESIIGIIGDIARRTNLLALNATIESARAGDAGRGFAVVAAEVRSLAGQSAKATQEIAGQIGAVQAATGEAVGAVRAIGTVISQIDHLSSTIAGAVEEQAATTREISLNIAQAANGAQSVVVDVQEVTGVAAMSDSLAENIGKIVNRLSDDTGRLAEEIETFLGAVVRIGGENVQTHGMAHTSNFPDLSIG